MAKQPLPCYSKSMQVNARSSITLPVEELRLVTRLRRRLRAKTNVAVVRSALRLLDETTSREQLRQAYRAAAARVRASTIEERGDLAGVDREGLSG